jgi:hypothetical protein
MLKFGKGADLDRKAPFVFLKHHEFNLMSHFNSGRKSIFESKRIDQPPGKLYKK